jgi:hypothetical protein
MRFCPCILLLSLLPSTAFSQGFSSAMGLRDAKTVGIKRLLPATVNLNQKRISIEAISAIQTNGELVMILKTKLVTMIQSDPRFIVDEKNPQTVLKFTVTNSYIEEKHYTIGTGNTAQACTGFTGKLEVSYQALDAANHAPFDSENLVAVIVSDDKKAPSFKDFLRPGKGGACNSGAKSSTHEAQDELVDGIVHQIRAAPTDEIITVKLPGKKLDSLSSLAMAQRWGTLEEEAEKAEKLPKPEDDAYRVYLIALAREAQAYDVARESAQRDEGKRTDISSEQAEKDFQKAQLLLDGARKSYKDAIQAKPNEKEFQEPDNRMEQAISVYAKIARHKEEYQKFLAAQPSNAPARPGGTGDSKQIDPSRNHPAMAATPLDQVVKFCQAGLDLGSITDYVKDASFLEDAKASSYSFNFKTDALILNANCKEKAPVIQKLMRERLAGPRRAAMGSGSKQ